MIARETETGSFLVACGVEDASGCTFTNGHFGESPFYHIYRVAEGEIPRYIGQVENPAAGEEENEHDENDPVHRQKPGKIGKVLKEQGVSVIMGRSIGTNVVKMRKSFVVVVSRDEGTEPALKRLGSRLSEVRELLAAGEGRGHLVLERS